MSDITDEIEKFRAVLKEYDDGLSSAASCHSQLHALTMDRFLDYVEKGQRYMTFGSCCCSGHPPDRLFKVQIIIQPHGFTAQRID